MSDGICRKKEDGKVRGVTVGEGVRSRMTRQELERELEFLGQKKHQPGSLCGRKTGHGDIPSQATVSEDFFPSALEAG